MFCNGKLYRISGHFGKSLFLKVCLKTKNKGKKALKCPFFGFKKP